MEMLRMRIGATIEFEYTNYKGEHGTRRAVIVAFEYGRNEYHHSSQMFMIGFDTAKGAVRTFATKDMEDVREARDAV